MLDMLVITSKFIIISIFDNLNQLPILKQTDNFMCIDDIKKIIITSSWIITRNLTALSIMTIESRLTVANILILLCRSKILNTLTFASISIILCCLIIWRRLIIPSKLIIILWVLTLLMRQTLTKFCTRN